MSRKRNISRRQFLGQASCAAIGSTAFLSTALNLGMINTAAARPHILQNPNDYKAIVCILLAGGADSFNMLMPIDDTRYNQYVNIRGAGDLALRRDAVDVNNPAQILPLNSDYGVHHTMTEVANLFNQGNLSFLANIGTLIEPIIDINDLEFGNKKIPLGLYSHADQIMQWQTSVPQNRSAVGVGGRMADILSDMSTLDGVSMNISLDGKNRFQAGNQVIEFSLANNSTVDNLGFEGFPSWYSNAGFLGQRRNEVINNLVEDVYSNIFQKTYGSLTRQTIASIDTFKAALSKKEDVTTHFTPDVRLSQDLRMMAEVMSVQSDLGNNRQIFFTTFGGWDHHDDVIGNQERMLPILSKAMGELHNALGQLGLQDKVTTFTISDFARTLTSNGNGSDHAWGGNSMIMGGAVDGGKIIGSYPEFDLSNALNIDERGRFIPTTSVDKFYADIATWFGVSANDLSYILPNIGNFDASPLGIFS